MVVLWLFVLINGTSYHYSSNSTYNPFTLFSWSKYCCMGHTRSCFKDMVLEVWFHHEHFLVCVLSQTQMMFPLTVSWWHHSQTPLPVPMLSTFSAVSALQLPLTDCRADRKWLKNNISNTISKVLRNRGVKNRVGFDLLILDSFLEDVSIDVQTFLISDLRERVWEKYVYQFIQVNS